jgi:hypothetical protein
MTDTQLRIQLQGCQSRIRLAIQALDLYQGRLLHLSGPLPIVDAAELITSVASIRELLSDGEEVQP